MKITKKLFAGIATVALLAFFAGCSNDNSIYEYENGETYDGKSLYNTMPSTTTSLTLTDKEPDIFTVSDDCKLTSGEYYTVKKYSSGSFRGITIEVKEDGSVIHFDAINQGSSSRTMFITNNESDTDATTAIASSVMSGKGVAGSATAVDVDAGTYYLSVTGDLRLTALSVVTYTAPDPRFSASDDE